MELYPPGDPNHVEWYLQAADAGPSTASASPSLSATAPSPFDDAEPDADGSGSGSGVPGEKGKGQSRDGKVRSCAPCRYALRSYQRACCD